MHSYRRAEIVREIWTMGIAIITSLLSLCFFKRSFEDVLIESDISIKDEFLISGISTIFVYYKPYNNRKLDIKSPY